MNLSPGTAHSSFELLALIRNRSMTYSEIINSFPAIGVMPTAAVLEHSLTLNWIRVGESDRVSVTSNGERIYAYELTEQKLRQTVLDFVDAMNPVWSLIARSGRRRVLTFVDFATHQVLFEAGLTHGVTSEVVQFWDDLAARARGRRDDRLAAIGRSGERLSIEYEQNRTGREPKWVSVDSNDDGYDILSVRSNSDLSRLLIEVKTTSVGIEGNFHITRNEWRRATDADAHQFHLWDVSSQPPRLAILSHELLQQHIPFDSGSGHWELATVPFIEFENYFRRTRTLQ